MAVVTRTRRVVNPARRRRVRRVKANPHRRRRLTAKQIKYFGSKRQKAALRNGRKRRHAVRARRANPRRIRRRATRNPALVVTLGAVNPRKRRKVVARRRRRSRKANPAARRRRTRIVVAAPRRHRRRRHVAARRSNPRRRYSRRRRNPILFGQSVSAGNMAKAVVGGLAGVAAAKLLPTFLPASLSSSPILRVVVSGASAYAASLAARKLGLGPQVESAVLFGGLMQTGSLAISAFAPASISSRLALSGMGELMPGGFSVPQNPLRLPPAPAQGPRVQMNGLARSFGNAF